MRSVRWVLSLALLSLPLTALSGDAGPRRCAEPGRLTARPDGWTTIRAPEFTSGGTAMTDLAVDSARPSRLVVTNGTAVTRSLDGGCTWTEAALPPDGFSLPTGEGSAVGQRRQLEVAMSQTPLPHSRVWVRGRLDALASASPVQRAVVLVSDDFGQSFRNADTGLPPLSREVDLAPTVAPDIAYLLLRETSPGEALALYVTSNGGASWAQRAGVLPPEVRRIVVHPSRPDQLWAYGDDLLLRSTDFGESFSPVTGAGSGPFSVVTLSQAQSGITVTAYSGRDPVRRVSTDGGATFVDEPAPAGVNSASGPLLPGVTAVSAPEGVGLYLPGRTEPVDITPEDAVPSDLTFQRLPSGGSGLDLFGLTPTDIYRTTFGADFRIPRIVVPKPPAPIQVDVRKPVVRPKAPTLLPGDVDVSLRPGQTRRIDYRVQLPPIPTPIDVYFMTDSTGSMQSAIRSVQENIQDVINALAASGVDVWFGVADFRDYNQAGTADTQFIPYRRHRAVGPINSELEDALESITIGSGRGADSALEALFQAATGAGRLRAPAVGPAGGYHIEPGLGAEFRDEALKVVLLATDESMRQPSASEPQYPGPRMATTITALKDHDVTVLGLAIQTASSGDPREDLVEVAQGTGSVAPSAGVDCDDDGAVDLPAGEPLVCDFAPASGSIAPTIVSLLEGVKDLAAVQARVEGPPGVVRAVGPLVFRDVNVKAFNELTFTVEATCDIRRQGVSEHRVSVDSRGTELVDALLTVRCAELPAEPQPGLIVPPLVAVAVAPPPPPPPAPVTNVNPNPNPNPNPQPNPQANANAGFATEQERQHQLALATTDLPPDEELAMSARPRGRPTPGPELALAAAFLLTAAAAARHRTTSRSALRTVPTRSRGSR